MPKQPSEATQLRTLKSEVRDLRIQLARTEQERDRFRARATQAEQEVSEWKKRFDLLLARTPEVKGEGA